MVGGTRIQKADWASLPVCPQGCPKPPQWLHHSSCRAKAKHVWLLCHICRKRCYRSRCGSTYYCNTWRIQKKLKTGRADCSGCQKRFSGRLRRYHERWYTCFFREKTDYSQCIGNMRYSVGKPVSITLNWDGNLLEVNLAAQWFSKKYKKINQHVIDLYIAQHRLYVYITLWNRIAYKILFWRTQKRMSGCVGS